MTKNNQKTAEFKSLPLDNSLLKILDEINYKVCTPIQAKCLPLSLKGQDVAGQAQTGTGKTAAFLLSVFNLLITQKPLRKNELRAIIIAPTRELAIQIHKDTETLNRYCDLKLGLVYGGIDYEKQRASFSESNIDILIGTPGRLIDYFKQGVFNLKHIEVVVLDEADRMFDLGFISDIRYILRKMPKPEKRLNMLFSATLSYRAIELAYEHMNNPKLVKIKSEKITADKITQTLYHIANEEKIPLLLGLLKSIKPPRSIVFVNTKRVAESIFSYMESNSIKSSVLSGDVPQKKRQSLLDEFSNGKIKVLIATDLAARGLHIPDVSHVFNYDLPQNSEDYVHRVGRTARAGTSGEAISFACENYVYSLVEIESYIGYSIPISKLTDELLITPNKPIAKKKYHNTKNLKKKNKPKNQK